MDMASGLRSVQRGEEEMRKHLMFNLENRRAIMVRNCVWF